MLKVRETVEASGSGRQRREHAGRQAACSAHPSPQAAGDPPVDPQAAGDPPVDPQATRSAHPSPQAAGGQPVGPQATRDAHADPQATRSAHAGQQTARSAHAGPQAAGGQPVGQQAAGGQPVGRQAAHDAHAAQPSVGNPQARLQPRRVRSFITRWRMAGVAAFSVVMVLGGVIGLLFFARPAASAVEMRTLTAFPEFTAESFLDGSYFTQVSLWYADTYPLREPMVAADHALDGLFGISTGVGMVGGNVKADEIPAAPGTAGSSAAPGSSGSAGTGQGQGAGSDEGRGQDAGSGEGQGAGSDEGEGQGASQQPEPEPVKIEPPAEPPDERVVAADIQANIMEGVYIKDGAGYGVYYFSQNAADTYVAAMNKAAERLDGTSTVYSILAPANSIMLSEQEARMVGGSDQQQTLDYLRTRFDSRVKPVEIVDDIIAHRDEYIYFHTDHHWTQLGAYYAYEAFCKVKGIEPVPFTSWREVDLGEFEGTYWDAIASMGPVQPDEVVGHVPNGTNEMKYWTADGEEVDAKIIDDEAADWDPAYKYSGFSAGDRPLETIRNPQVTDGSSCLIVKDSYGCAFIPNLVDSYETIHVIDFRETDRNICDYALENGIDDVIFLTNIKIGLTDSVAATLLSEVS